MAKNSIDRRYEKQQDRRAMENAKLKALIDKWISR